MHPKDFVKQWGCTGAELSDLLNYSQRNTRSWLSEESDASPPEHVLERLEEIHLKLIQWKLEDEHIPRLKSFYELVKDRK